MSDQTCVVIAMFRRVEGLRTFYTDIITTTDTIIIIR